MRHRLGILFLSLVLAFSLASGLWAAEIPTTMVQKNCLNCHKGYAKMEAVLAGNVKAAAIKARFIQLTVNNKPEMLALTKETQVVNVPDLKSIKGGMAVRVHYGVEDGKKFARKVVVKPKIEVPEDQIISVRDLAVLVAQGPEKGAYTLVDSRPPAGYQKGHIPTAISIPFPKMKGMMDKLPKNKDQLVVFYCQGYR